MLNNRVELTFHVCACVRAFIVHTSVSSGTDVRLSRSGDRVLNGTTKCHKHEASGDTRMRFVTNPIKLSTTRRYDGYQTCFCASARSFTFDAGACWLGSFDRICDRRCSVGLGVRVVRFRFSPFSCGGWFWWVWVHFNCFFVVCVQLSVLLVSLGVVTLMWHLGLSLWFTAQREVLSPLAQYVFLFCI